jgi:hypothetical protein
MKTDRKNICALLLTLQSARATLRLSTRIKRKKSGPPSRWKTARSVIPLWCSLRKDRSCVCATSIDAEGVHDSQNEKGGQSLRHVWKVRVFLIAVVVPVVIQKVGLEQDRLLIAKDDQNAFRRAVCRDQADGRFRLWHSATISIRDHCSLSAEERLATPDWSHIAHRELSHVVQTTLRAAVPVPGRKRPRQNPLPHSRCGGGGGCYMGHAPIATQVGKEMHRSSLNADCITAWFHQIERIEA